MYRTIVVGTDGSASSLEAVRQAAELASAGGAALHVVIAVADTTDLAMAASMATAVPVDLAAGMTAAASEALEHAVAAARAAGVEPEGHVLHGEPSEVLIHQAEHLGADLLVVGNRGMTGAARFLLGSVPNRCAHHAPCSVLIVHSC